MCIYIWGFPKMKVPLNHLFLVGFSILNHPFGDTPMTMESHINIYIYISYRFRHSHFSTFCSDVVMTRASSRAVSRPDSQLVSRYQAIKF